MPLRSADEPGDTEAPDSVALRRRDPDASERAAEYRRRHKHPDELCGPGNRPGSWKALKRLNGVLTVCGAEGCGTLGALPRVLRAAHAAKRTAISPIDGCASRRCSRSRWHQPPRHAATQRRWAAELRAGVRQLVVRPLTIEQESAQRLGGADLEAAVNAALSQLAR
jgi:hypothetical protein